jgi:hypothetical protein
MNIKSLHKYIFGLGLSLFIVSCSLDEYNPAAIEEDVALNNYEGWKDYQAVCYTGLWNTLINCNVNMASELGTDLWTFPFQGTNAKDIMAYQEFTTASGYARDVWNGAWNSIKDCNKVIRLGEQLTDGSAEDIMTLIAETRFLRAYYYSMLVAHFGRVPLFLADDGEKSTSPQRAEVAEIYTQILADLRFAFNNLPVEPFEGNLQRVTKKAALGLMARAYAQGGGEELTEGGKSYWERAKEVADSLINNQADYGARIYDNFADVFAAGNNKDNEEALFIAYGRNAYNQASLAQLGSAGNMNVYLFYYPKITTAIGTDMFKKDPGKNTVNAYYGRLNMDQSAPTKYLIDAFEAQYDRRWENTFVTAFTNYSGVQAIAAGTPPAPADVPYADAIITLDGPTCAKYGIDVAHIDKKIYPYIDVNWKAGAASAGNQYIPKVWKKGEHSGVANDVNLEEKLNANVHPYPLEADEDRFFCYLSKESLTPTEKAQRAYLTINIDDLFDLTADPKGSVYKANVGTNGLTPSSLATLFPAMMKFNHNFDGGWASNFQTKIGNIIIMRMAEVYLIAAEAAAHTNHEGQIAGYLQPLRERAERNPGDAASMGYGSSTIDDVLDEYARELCGEYNRWTILKRNKAFEHRLEAHNPTAFRNFNKDKHYLRPIPLGFLQQIENATEFGTNGY